MQWLVAVAVTLALTGCIDLELVECADGRLCPRGTACDVAHDSCVAPDQLTACDGLADFESCRATGVDDGRCFSGVCLPKGCGNGLVEPDELCDDGNVASGDGCSADCTSREVCGDGVADELRGEACDDGNTRGRDGCTNACTAERPVWHLRLQDTPAPRSEAAAAYDPLHRQVVVFGGVDKTGAVLDDTWGLDATGWSTLLSGTPERRRLPGMAYDPVRHRVVMFGGYSSSSQGVLLNDTWEWSGVSWQRATSASVPPARMRTALAWDGTRVIMFGGSQLSGQLGDTWAWDGSTWMRLSPASSPTPREGHAMVFDPKHARVVLFGGLTPTATDETWTFDGTNWAPLSTLGTPPLLQWAALAYDEKRDVVVLSGVQAGTNNNVLWELDGAQWVDKQVDVAPNITGGAVLAYDSERERVVQYGGDAIIGGDPRDDIWEWDGVMWRLRPAPPLPAARQLCAIASDPVRGRVVMFGGQGDTIPLDDTWEWDGRTWRQFAGQGPPLRVNAAMAYDGSAREVVLFGGVGAEVYGDTWRFDGTRWLEAASTGPAPRYGHAMAYDSKRERVWLFGGEDGSQWFADIWQWDGTTWTQHTPMNGPSARSHARLAYDTALDRVVMFGGVAADGTKLTDTWAWDGTAWAELMSLMVPEGRSGFGLVYDRMRARVTLFGGVISGFSLWELDGAQWMQPDATLVPVVSNGACAAYDDARGEIVAFGGMRSSLQRQTATGSYRGDREEVCHAGLDLDADGATGCDDDDCRAVCAPLCWDDPACTAAPRCGDGTCSSLELEAGASCAADCP